MKTLEELKKEFKNSLTYSYFVFSKTKKPEFRTFEEANSWYNSQNHIAEAVIGMSLDNLMTVVEQAIKEAREQTLKEVESIIIGKDDVPMPEYRRRVLRKMGGHDDIYEDDCTVKTNNLLRHEQRSRLKKLSQQEV